ncbi:hypothetical protein U1Q18_048961 [Sarracenia purpurea var. burkii]
MFLQPTHSFQLLLLLLLTFQSFQVRALAPNLYKTLVALPNHVDKSEMLRYIFDQNATNQTDVPYYFINCPRGFGKSVNLDMINSFASFEYKSDGQPKHPNDTTAYQIFKKLKISKYDNLMSQHMARYPVLSLDLTGVGSLITNIEQTMQDINSLLWFELENFPQLKSVNSTTNQYNITDTEITFMNQLRQKQLAIDQIVNSLYIFKKILYKFFNETKVVLLIDEYDYTAFKSPATLNSHAQDVYYVINDMIAQSLIMGRQYTKAVIISGISTLSYGLDRVLGLTTRHYPFLDDHEFTHFYGITESELIALFDKYKCTESERRAVRAHYKGYQTSSKHMTIYNTQSIFQYFHVRGMKSPRSWPIESYWRKVDSPGCLAPYIKHSGFRTKFYELLDNKTIKYSIEKSHSSRSLYNLEDLRDRNFTQIDSDDSYLGLFFTDMFELGYLSHGPGEENSYRVPNQEIREILHQELRIYKERYEGVEITTSCIILLS